MTWFKVDDTLAFHNKVIQAGNTAMGLWVRAGAWASQQLTDGFVPEYMVTVLGSPTQARRLVAVGLWTASDGGYQFHEWTGNSGETRNPTRREVLERRAKETERQAKKRAQKSANTQVNDGSPPVTPPVTTPVTPPVSTNGSPAFPVPARPDQVTPTELLNPPNPPPGGQTETTLATSTPAPEPQPTKTASNATAYPDDFLAFWEHYPRKEAKKGALKSWQRALNDTTPETIIEGAKRYAAARDGQDPKFDAMPTTWLNQGRWDDEPPPARAPQPAMSTGDERVMQIQAMKDTWAPDSSDDDRLWNVRALPQSGGRSA